MTEAEEFRAAVAATGLSNRVLARRMGITRQAIQCWLRGARPVPTTRMAEVQAIAEGR